MKKIVLFVIVIYCSLYSGSIGELNSIENFNRDNNLENLSYEHNLFNYDLLENVINPVQYLVGPGDIFAFNMLSADGIINFDLIVNPTGEILIPAIGTILINDMSLDASIDLIKQECLKKYPNSNVHISLIKIRKFKVQITGINNTISYIEASPILRISDILPKIFNNHDKNHVGLNISERNIKILRKDNTLKEVDLLSFRRFGDKSKNPTLMQGDVIELQLQENYIGIYGGIKMPGRYEIVKNESLEQLINLAGGFTKNADINNIEITRFINDTDKKIIRIDSKKDLENIFLNDEDHIIVRYKQDYKRQDLVTVNGEVKYPGLYSITHNSTTIKEIIEKCGGLSSKADLSKIKINNEFISSFEDRELNRIKLIPDQYRSDEEKSYIKARSQSPKGHLNSSDINFTELIMDFRLNRNDIILIPEAVDYIEILGGVYHPGRYPYYSDYSFEDYITLSGGYTKTAKSKKYILKNSNGQKITFNKNLNIENGDIIFIPEKIEYSRWDRFKEIIAVLSQLATLLVVIQSVG